MGFAAGLASAVAIVHPVHAIPAPPPMWTVVNADVPLAANGVLLFELRTSGLRVQGDTITVMVAENPGASVSGAVESLAITTTNRYRVFRPANALTSGKSYVATALSNGFSTSMSPFMATGAALIGAPEVAFDGPRFDITQKTVSQSCCEFQAGARGPQPCVVTEAQQQAMLTFKATFPDPSAARQFLYRVVLTTPAPATENTHWVPAKLADGLTVIAERESDEYCYRIEAFALVLGSRHELTEMCVRNPLPPLERVRATDTDIRIALDIARCGVPPMEFLDAWCDENHFACTGGSPYQAPCMASKYEQRCEGIAGASGAGGAVSGASGQSGRAGTGAAGGAAIGGGTAGAAGGTTGMSGAGAAGEGSSSTDDNDDDADPEHRTAGCGCRIGSSAHAPWLTATMFAALAFMLTIRRRQRR